MINPSHHWAHMSLNKFCQNFFCIMKGTFGHKYGPDKILTKSFRIRKIVKGLM